jgi:transposase-like protein
MTQVSFKRHRFLPTSIRHCVWLYALFTLSYRDIEEMLAERGIDMRPGIELRMPEKISSCRRVLFFL